MLVGALDAHPEIVCHYEIFHVDDIYYSGMYDFDWSKHFTKETRNERPQKFLNFVLSQALSEKTKAIGFKIFQDQNNSFMKKIANRDDIDKVFLKRKNYLLSRVSQLEAEQSGVYDITIDKKDRLNKSQKIFLDIEKFLYYENRKRLYFEQFENIAKTRNQRMISLEYETLLEIENQKKLLSFLEVEPNPDLLEIRFKKQNEKKLKDRIVNYKQLCARLSGTPYEKYLEE
jgi:LPS sulfotransferase NodH